MGVCGNKRCKKRGKANNKGTNGKLYCTIACREADGATLCAVAKAKKVSFNVCSLLLLLVLLLLTFSFHSFLYHLQMLQDAKSNAKVSAALVEAAIAENVRLRALGVEIEADLTDREVFDVAEGVVLQIKANLPPGHRCYVFSSQSGERIMKEAWASLSGRGGGTRLITLPDRVPIDKGTLQDNYGWSCVSSIYMSNNANNMNRIEKTAHWILFGDLISIWLGCGMGGVQQKEGDLRSFSLSYICGSPAGLEFAAQHPRTLRPDLVNQLNNLRTAPRPRALPRIQAVQVAEPNASSQLIIRDEDDNGGGKLRAINDDVIEPRKRAGSRFRILESDDDDDDGAIKPSAMVATPPKKKTTTKKATTKRPAQHQPMSNISNVDYFASMVSANSPQKKKWKKYEFDFWKNYESESD